MFLSFCLPVIFLHYEFSLWNFQKITKISIYDYFNTGLGGSITKRIFSVCLFLFVLFWFCLPFLTRIHFYSFQCQTLFSPESGHTIPSEPQTSSSAWLTLLDPFAEVTASGALLFLLLVQFLLTLSTYEPQWSTGFFSSSSRFLGSPRSWDVPGFCF